MLYRQQTVVTDTGSETVHTFDMLRMAPKVTGELKHEGYRVEVIHSYVSGRFTTFRADWLYNGKPDICPILSGKHDAGGTCFNAEDILDEDWVLDVAELMLVIFSEVREFKYRKEWEV